ncbi:Alpha/beta hydrolase fold-1 [Dillenia turbinata]|uniref:Alpha/beta hydrolase fold-1 n=1 Tax=Dillenia turbinata TaxID=194707 RepID=A0AAN8VTZ1_9MAGN
MEMIEHKIVKVNGLNMHVAEIGEGQPILFLHGFPELWYSWRHQMVYLAEHGYRAIAPDLRGYGDTDAPPSASSYSALHIVGDLVALLDLLGLDQVFLVGHDWGAAMAWYFCLFRPDRIKALVNLSVPFWARNPSLKPIHAMRCGFGEDYYMCKFQEAKAEEEFARYSTAALFRYFLTSRTPNMPRPQDGAWFGTLPDIPNPLPDWLSEDDISYYATKFDQKVGDQDVTYNTPGVKEYIHNGGFETDVPGLEEVVVMKGVYHFLNQEAPQEINKYIHEFFQKF